MHKDLKAIGFQKIASERAMMKWLQNLTTDYTDYDTVDIEEGLEFGEFRKSCGDRIGVASCGYLEEQELFDREYYYPYLEGSGVSSYSNILVDYVTERRQYYAIVADPKIGSNLVFYVQNGLECMRMTQYGNAFKRSTSVTLAGLAQTAMILLPLSKTPEQEKESREKARNRMMLLSAARNGDEKALETLSIEDMTEYTMIAKRMISEDVYSIVESSFIPVEHKLDAYRIIGEIRDVRMTVNTETDEALYILTVDVNELVFDICVPMENVMGVPEVGRRIKAEISLQGRINFNEK